MCNRRFPGASQSSGSYVQSVIQYQRLHSRLLLSRWYCRGWTTEMPSWPVFLPTCLQSVMNVVARLIYGLRHSDHISDALISRYWLRAQERVRFKTAMLMYKATHGIAPSYLSQLVRVANLPGRRSLHSARTNHLLVPSVKLSTIGGRAFPVAGPTIWNSLPENVISAPSLSTFRQHLKTFLFQASFPDIIIDPR